jgi:hypothetical protein
LDKLSKLLLLKDLGGFAKSKPTLLQKIKYLVLGIAYLFFLAQELSEKKTKEHSSGSQAGDDIYPLF